MSQISEGQKQAKDLVNLKSKSVGELKELLERHNSILSKARLVANLPDKGAKLRSLQERVQAELYSRTNPSSADSVAESLAAVRLTEGLEWNLTEGSTAAVPGDGGQQDPLYTLLQASKESSNLDPYVEALCSKFGSSQPQPSEERQKFLPFRSTQFSPKSKAAGTQQTFPAEHSTKQLALKESMNLEKTQAERTASKFSSAGLLTTWRQIAAVSSDTEEEEEEEAAQVAALEEAESEDPPEVPCLDTDGVVICSDTEVD